MTDIQYRVNIYAVFELAGMTAVESKELHEKVVMVRMYLFKQIYTRILTELTFMNFVGVNFMVMTDRFTII